MSLARLLMLKKPGGGSGTLTAGDAGGYRGYASSAQAPFPPAMGSITGRVTSFGQIEAIYWFGNPEYAVALTSASGVPSVLTIDGQPYDLELDISESGWVFYNTTGTPAGHPNLVNGVTYNWSLS